MFGLVTRDAMKKIKTTAVCKACHPDLKENMRTPLNTPVTSRKDKSWIANGRQKPVEICDSARESMSAFVMALAHGGTAFHDDWMKNPESTMISCNDSFRPVSLYIEAMDKNAE